MTKLAHIAGGMLGTPRTRAVHRAIAEARRGVPVVLAARHPLIIVPAETVGAEGLRLIDTLSNGPAMLLLSPSRAAAVLQHEVADKAPAIALRLARPLIDAETLKRAADPTLE
ncbi:MAG TPA: GTP cyclohydrolase II, partial [Acidocella sp.]|nr:GTP cyclohydrolase II [Acidocella sp.]